MDDYKGQLRRKNRRRRCEGPPGSVHEFHIMCFCGYREDPPKKIKTRIVRKNIKKNDRKLFKNYE